MDDKINNDENNNNEPPNELIIGGCKIMFDPKIIIIFLLPQMQMEIFEERMRVKNWCNKFILWFEWYRSQIF